MFRKQHRRLDPTRQSTVFFHNFLIITRTAWTTYTDNIRWLLDPNVRRQALVGYAAVGRQPSERSDTEDKHDDRDNKRNQTGRH